MPIERKYERDVDLLLAEEFALNPAFATSFKSLTKFANVPAQVSDFWISKGDNLGESDLIVVYQADDTKRFALLIEDKVDAPLQPDQAARYRLRADRDIALGVYGDYELLLCAPCHYIESHSDLAGFDHLVPLEKIADMIRNHNGLRAEYRAHFLETAATKRINTWSRNDDTDTNEFWNAAYELATREFHQLEMKPRKLTKGTAWITIRPHDFPTQPTHTYISLKGDRGYVDLTFGNTTAYRFKPTIADLLHADMSVHQTGKAAAIRIEASGFSVADGVAAGMPKVKVAFEAALRLIALTAPKSPTITIAPRNCFSAMIAKRRCAASDRPNRTAPKTRTASEV